MTKCPNCAAALHSSLPSCPYCGHVISSQPAGSGPTPAGSGFGQPAQGGFGQPAQGGFGPPAQGGFGAPRPAAPGVGPYAAPREAAQGYPMGMAGAPAGPAPNTGLALGLSIACMLCCCLPGGIWALVNANQAKSAVAMGDYVTANEKIRQAYTIIAICAVLGAIANVLAFFANLSANQ